MSVSFGFSSFLFGAMCSLLAARRKGSEWNCVSYPGTELCSLPWSSPIESGLAMITTQ